MGRMLVWGAGAIGGTVAAFLARAGHDITVVDASPAHVAAVREKGLRIVGPVAEFTQPLNIVTPAELEGRWGAVALAVKAQFTGEACDQLLPHLEADGYVVSLQNGLCESLIAGKVGPARTIGALIGFAGDMLGPGEVRFGMRDKFAIGELDGTVTRRIRELAGIFADFEPQVEISTDIAGGLWGKLGFMALLYGGTLGTSPQARLWADEELFPLWRALVSETVETALAQGINPAPIHGMDMLAFRVGAPAAGARAGMAAIVDFVRGSPKTHSGMWRDIAIHRKKTEAEAQIPPVLALAAKHGVAAPALGTFYELYRQVEDRAVAQDDRLAFRLLPAAMQSPVNRAGGAAG